jgi:hypothetical protein
MACGSGARNRVKLSGTYEEGSIFLEKLLQNDCKSSLIRRLSYISSLKKHNPCAREEPFVSWVMVVYQQGTEN